MPAASYRFNRTFMELKYACHNAVKPWFDGFNRTFMELKWTVVYGCWQVHHVSIVPLWNWNLDEIFVCETVFISFNRTFMELKYNILCYGSILKGVSIVPLWNWNSVSLVCNITGHVVSIVPLWNWNDTEELLTLRVSDVSIVPLWNWNSSFTDQPGTNEQFQSYLYGIEINYQILTQALQDQFQSYLYGIEIPATSARTQWKDRFNRTFMELKF